MRVAGTSQDQKKKKAKQKTKKKPTGQKGKKWSQEQKEGICSMDTIDSAMDSQLR